MSSSSYPTAYSIVADCISDTNWLITFGVSCGFWIAVRLSSQSIYHSSLSEKHKAQRSKDEFSDVVMSTLHAFMLTIVSFLVIGKYFPVENELLTEQCAEDAEHFIYWYKQISVISAAYFSINSLDLALFIPNSMVMKVGFIIHHLLALICMLLIYPVHPIYSYFSALVFQVEFSTLFLNLKFFAVLFARKDLYFIGGIGVFSTYPLQRIVFLGVVLNIYMSLKDVFYTYSNMQHYWFGVFCQVFIIFLSALCFFIMVKNPKKQICLKTDKHTK